MDRCCSSISPSPLPPLPPLRASTAVVLSSLPPTRMARSWSDRRSAERGALPPTRMARSWSGRRSGEPEATGSRVTGGGCRGHGLQAQLRDQRTGPQKPVGGGRRGTEAGFASQCGGGRERLDRYFLISSMNLIEKILIQ